MNAIRQGVLIAIISAITVCYRCGEGFDVIGQFCRTE